MPTGFPLFDVFAANLGLYWREYTGLFMCPLCLRTFSRDQVNDLSKAHIMPKFVGKRDLTLACMKCNNKVGTEIESYGKERANFNWALSGDGNETTRISTSVSNEQGDVVGPVQADMRGIRSGGDRRLHVNLQPKASNPEALRLLNDHLSAGRGPIQFQFRETRSSKRANLTYVHAAYLHMFHQFGYEWVFTPGAELIRKQITSPDKLIIRPLFPALSGLLIPNDELAVFLVTHPADFRSFLVIPPLLRGSTQRQGVWMPLIGCQYGQPPQREGVSLTAVPVPNRHQFLHMPDSKLQGCRFVLYHLAKER